MTIPKLSVLCLAFNHVHFIRQALDGFVMQQTNFPFEVLIHDDASTDGTAEIIREYEAKYPEIIKPIYQTENQWSKGVPVSKKFQFPRVQSEYVAMCEGDDYWTDPLKLQKQVDFLDAHPDYSVCSHLVDVYREGNPKRLFQIPSLRERGLFRTSFDVKDVAYRYFFHTSSLVLRWVYHDKESLDDYPTDIVNGDWFIELIHAKHGKVKLLLDTMSVYRLHEGGIWGASTFFSPVLRYGRKSLNLFRRIDIALNHKYAWITRNNEKRVLFSIYRESVKYNNFDTFNDLKIKMPFFFQWEITHKLIIIFMPRKRPTVVDLAFDRIMAYFFGSFVDWSHNLNPKIDNDARMIR